MSTFSKGDQARCVETWTTYVIDSGDKFTVDDVRVTVSGVQQVYVQGEWVPACYFEKVEPEWVVGQQVKDGDYALLPVGAKAGVDVTKTSAEGWTWDVDGVEWPNKEWYSPRTLTHLPETPEPEDTADAEPEPLKEGASGSLAGASEAFEQMANAMHDFAVGFEKAGKIFWREMQRVRDGGAS